jgi:predicted DNA-binding transcriptional regulator YafY
MKSDSGWSVELETYRIDRKAYFRYKDKKYSIKNARLNETEANQLKEALLTLNRIKGLPQFEWVDEMITKLETSFNASSSNDKVIGFDHMPYLKGINFISEFYQKIIFKRVLEIKYQPFNSNELTLTIHPYYLKHFNNRWFLFGLSHKDNTIKNLPLDRIQSFVELNIDYVNSEIDFEDYFDDVIGVSVRDVDVDCVKLKVNFSLWPYINTKPFHGSQKIIENNDDFTVIRLDLKPNYELEAKILQHGENVEVLEPIYLRDQLVDRIHKMKKQYI